MHLFFKVSTSLHQVCSSIFVQTPWLQSLISNIRWSTVPVTDFRIQGFGFFLNLNAMCAMGNDQVKEAVYYLLNLRLNTAELVPEAQLTTKANGENGPMRQWYTSSFMHKYQFALDSVQTSHMMTIYSSNWAFYGNQTTTPSIDRPLRIYPVSYGSNNCSCSTSTSCTQPLTLNGQAIPGFTIGCIPMESILRSTLVCLYNQTCINQINIGRFNASQPLLGNTLLKSLFPMNSTVKDLAKELFLEKWSVNASYADYYKECAPTSCFYSISNRSDPLAIAFSLLGLYGGLTVALRLIVPNLVTLGSRVKAILLRCTSRVGVVV